MVSKKFKKMFISFGNLDRNYFREVMIVKFRLEQIKEIVGDKELDLVSVDYFFKRICCDGEESNMMVEKVEF